MPSLFLSVCQPPSPSQHQGSSSLAVAPSLNQFFHPLDSLDKHFLFLDYRGTLKILLQSYASVIIRSKLVELTSISMATPSTLNSDIPDTHAVVVFHWLLPPTAAFYYVISACITLALGQRQRDAGRLLRRITLCFVGTICIAYVLLPE